MNVLTNLSVSPCTQLYLVMNINIYSWHFHNNISGGHDCVSLLNAVY